MQIYFFFFLILIFLIQSSPSYYRLIDDISFNFNNKKEDKIDKLKKYFTLTPNSYIGNNIMLIDINQKDNKGILELKNPINSNDFEIQISFKLTPENISEYGTIFYIWFYNKVKQKGNGFVIYKNHSESITYFYPIITNKTIFEITFDELLFINNKDMKEKKTYCSTINFLDNYKRITIRIKNSNMDFYFNSSLSLFSACLNDFKGDNESFINPLYFSIGAINKNQFRSSVEITKIRFFDKENKKIEFTLNHNELHIIHEENRKHILKILWLFIFIIALVIYFLYKFLKKKKLIEEKID